MAAVLTSSYTGFILNKHKQDKSKDAREKILTQYILTTKIQVPPLPPQTVQRTRLLQELDRGLQPNIRVTLISAPAGYGKTTLLSDWLKKRDLAVAWLSISEGDNDAARFMSYLIATAVRSSGSVDVVEEGLDVPIVKEGKISVEDLKQEQLVPLINQICRRPKATVFIFDDYHLIRSESVRNLTSYLIENLPSQAHVFIATRADPPLPITRLRGRGQVNELRLEDLRFQDEEAKTFFNVVSGLHLTSEEIQTLQKKTEGWICGLQMTAAYLRGQEDTKAFIEDFSGSHHYIMDYLLDEVLRRESQEIQIFLLETSILERLCGPLCDAVLSEGTAAHMRADREPTLQEELPSDGRQILRDLEQANLFIVPLDEQREWYRYHRLFADLLQARLQVKDAHRIPLLHRRASVWFAEQDYSDDAIGHAFLSSDAEFAASTLEIYAQEILLRSETTTLLHWLQRLPEEQIRKRPKLGIYRAWALLLQGAPLSAVQAQISQSRFEFGPPGSSHSLEAFILLLQGQIEQGLQHAQKALELLPIEEIFLRDFATLCLAGCRISMGNIDGGVQLVDQISQNTTRPDNRLATALILNEIAELRLKQFRIDEAEELYRKSLAIGTTSGGTLLPVAGQALMGLGDVATERFDFDSAQRQLNDGIKLVERWSLISTLQGYLSLAMLHDTRDTIRGVREPSFLQDILITLEDLARRFDATEYDDIIVEMIKMRIYLREGRLDAVRQWVFDRGLERLPAHKPAHADDGTLAGRIYKYELPILARLFIAKGRCEDALTVLQELARLAEAAERPFLLIESLILQAGIFDSMGDKDLALNVLGKALILAGPQQARRIFLAEGETIFRLLDTGRQVWEAIGRTEFVDSLLAVRTGLPSPDPAVGTVQITEPLSPRELEVLQLLPTGLTAVEMADELFISANTLRSHLKNIYAKLSVHSRQEAVVKAAQLNLI
jgi:LuxR family maltose regulon positive regulatory protein